jgi:15-cis-phytoene synthase
VSPSRALALSAAKSRPWRGDLLRQGRHEAQSILAAGSKSFALAGLLLGPRARDDAAVLYAWCRQADDRVDEAGAGGARPALRRLGRELDALFAGRVESPLDVALYELVERRRIPRAYFQALLDGFAMDAEGARYATLSELDLYAYRVAGVVGLMMCHVLGVRDDRCLKAAAHLGMGMQLTNIARDVAEDFARGRQYLPTEQVAVDDLKEAMTSGPDHPSRQRVAAAVAVLLRRADGYYRSGLAGLADLDWRDALAIGAAGRIYRAIGKIIARRNFDSLRGRAVVSLARKLLSTLAAVVALAARVSRHSAATKVPHGLVRYDDVQS